MSNLPIQEIVVVGPPGVGKSTLIQYLHEDYKPNHIYKYESSFGLERRGMWYWSGKDKKEGLVEFGVISWEGVRPIKLFTVPHAMYMIVFSWDDTPENIVKQIEMSYEQVKKCAPESPFFIVGTKGDACKTVKKLKLKYQKVMDQINPEITEDKSLVGGSKMYIYPVNSTDNNASRAGISILRRHIIRTVVNRYNVTGNVPYSYQSVEESVKTCCLEFHEYDGLDLSSWDLEHGNNCDYVRPAYDCALRPVMTVQEFSDIFCSGMPKDTVMAVLQYLHSRKTVEFRHDHDDVVLDPTRLLHMVLLEIQRSKEDGNEDNIVTESMIRQVCDKLTREAQDRIIELLMSSVQMISFRMKDLSSHVFEYSTIIPI